MLGRALVVVEWKRSENGGPALIIGPKQFFTVGENTGLGGDYKEIGDAFDNAAWVYGWHLDHNFFCPAGNQGVAEQTLP
jgi:hypothetical protein